MIINFLLDKLIIICLILSASHLTSAQSFLDIQGKLLNHEDSSTVIGAHVYVENTNIGTITNKDGIFSIKIDSTLSKHYIKISCIGYQSQLIKVGFLSNSSESSIYLKLGALVLDEIIVYTPDAIKEIFKNAIDKAENYHIGVPIEMKTFYRELLKQDSNYVRLTDAVMKVYQDNFYSNDINNRKVKLVESRLSNDMTQNNITYKMNPSRLINRLRPLNFPPNIFDDYEFEMSITNIDTSKVYAISTKPKKNLQKIALDATIYIRKYDTAFIGYDAKVSEEHIKYFPEEVIHIKYKGRRQKVKVSVVEELLSSRFFEYENHWYLRNTSVNKTHKLWTNDRRIQILLNMDAQLIVYDLKVGDVTPPNKTKTINCNKPLSPTKPYNAEFWDSFSVSDYTVIEKEIKSNLEKKQTLNKQFTQND